jgi:hypothetical protein
MISKNNKLHERGEVWHSMTIHSRDVFDRNDYQVELTYTSERFLVIDFASESLKFKNLPKRKITRFRKHPNTSRIFERLKKYFPGLGRLENGVRLEISGSTLFTDHFLEHLDVDLDFESFDQMSTSIPKGKCKLLNSKNKVFRKEWQVDDPAILIINGVEHFIVGNQSDWRFYSSSELKEMFNSKNFEYTQTLEGYKYHVVFSQFSDLEAAAFYDDSLGRDYFFFSGPLVLNFYCFFRRLFNLQYPQGGLANLVKVAFSSVETAWSFQSGELSLSMNAPDRDLALIKDIIGLTNWNHEYLQRGVKKVTVKDDSGNLVGIVSPINRNQDGDWSHGYWKLKYKGDDDGYLFKETGTALEGVLSVTGGSNFTLSTVDDYEELKWKRSRAFHGKPGLITFDSDSFQIEDCMHFNVKFEYVRPKES